MMYHILLRNIGSLVVHVYLLIPTSVSAFTTRNLISLQQRFYPFNDKGILFKTCAATVTRRFSTAQNIITSNEKITTLSEKNNEEDDVHINIDNRAAPPSHFHDFDPFKPFKDRFSSAEHDRFSSCDGEDHNSKSQKTTKWLEWIGFRCQEAPVGTLAPHVVKDITPVMNIYAKQRSKKGAVMAESLLRRIVDEAEAGNDAVELTNTVFNVAIDGWAKSGERSSGEHAERIFSWMNRIRKEGNHPNVKQDTISSTSVINAWASSNTKGSARRACEILNLMEKRSSEDHEVPEPNTVTYNVCLAALARSNDRNAAIIAEELVERMEKRSRSDSGKSNVRPDVVSYQSLIHAWSNSRRWGSPQRAEEILKHMDDLSRNEQLIHGDRNVKPNVFCFTAVINAWSKSVEQDKVQRARNILTYMRRLYEEGRIDDPANVVAFTAVINAACYPCFDKDGSNRAEKKKEAFEIAVVTMNELRACEHADANHVTYAAFLNACFRLIPDSDDEDGNDDGDELEFSEEFDDTDVVDKRRIVKQTFEQAAQDGQVGYVVVDKLLSAAPQDLILELIPTLQRHVEGVDDDGSTMTLPDARETYSTYVALEWKRNVTGEKISSHERSGAAKSQKIKRMDDALTGSTVNHRRARQLSKLRGKSGYYSKRRRQ